MARAVTAIQRRQPACLSVSCHGAERLPSSMRAELLQAPEALKALPRRPAVPAAARHELDVQDHCDLHNLLRDVAVVAVPNCGVRRATHLHRLEVHRHPLQVLHVPDDRVDHRACLGRGANLARRQEQTPLVIHTKLRSNEVDGNQPHRLASAEARAVRHHDPERHLNLCVTSTPKDS